jgi:thiol reductant ABC exporter CydD subunit
LLVIAWVAVLDVEAALIMLLTLPLVPLFMWLIGRYTEQRTQERWVALRRLSTHFLDVVRGLPTLKAFDRARDETVTLASVSERYRKTTIETLRISFLSGSVLELAATLGVALVAVATGLRLVSGSLGLQAGLTVLILAPELYLPFRRLGAEYHASADGLAVAERMFELLDAPATAVQGGPRPAPSPAQAAVRFEDVGFSYPARPAVVLDGLDLELTPGQTVALVGESGAGKSTVAALLLGLLEPTTGRISIGGVPLASCRREAWHAQTAWVPQHPSLFRGSIAENIRLGDPAASEHRVREAARRAGAEAFIHGLPQGYGTLIGDGGRALSPGERRRIGLARAFLKDAPLVVLDEPAADLDRHSVAIVSGAVRGLQAGRTVLLIAHRTEMIEHADRVVRLVGGAAFEAALPRAA